MGVLGVDQICLRCGKNTPDVGMPNLLLSLFPVCTACSPIVIQNLKDLIIQ